MDNNQNSFDSLGMNNQSDSENQNQHASDHQQVPPSSQQPEKDTMDSCMGCTKWGCGGLLILFFSPITLIVSLILWFMWKDNPQRQNDAELVKKTAIASGIVLGISILFSACSAFLGLDENLDTPQTEPNTEQVETSENESSEGQESENETTESENSDEDVPREYKNALNTAQKYVDTMSFSEAGLYEQLTSEYGSQYPEEAAQYAIENVDVDYNEEALESAQSYQEHMPMSDDALFDQLTSEYGDQFTAEQAQYAIDNLD